ncbi:MAG: T9SS type A sorting domain-containing protein [Bacteroidota bacterium]
MPTYELVGGATCPDALLDVPVVTRNFEAIVSLQFSIAWDTTQLALESIVSLDPLLENSLLNTNLLAEGKMAFSWMDNDLEGQMLAENTPLFVLRFRALRGGAAASIQFANDPALVETIQRIDDVLTPVMSDLVNGTIDLLGPEIESFVIEPVANGNDGGVDLTIVGGQAPLSFLWSNGATTEDLEAVPAGTYFCTLTDATPCTIERGPFEVPLATSITTLPSEVVRFDLWPNPTSSVQHCVLQLQQALPIQLTFFDGKGQMLEERQFFVALLEQNFDWSTYPQGIYFLQLRWAKGQILQKIVVSP